MLNIITNGYILPFLSKPNLVKFPLIISEYKALQKDQAVAVCIQSLLSKNAIERLNTFLHIEKFKMETPESIRASLIPGEWVASIDLSDAYLHIPIHPNSRKYLRFLPQVSGVPVHLPFVWTGHSPPGLYNDRKGSQANGPLQRTQTSPIPGHWLIRSQSQEEALVNTQAMVDLTQSLGWIINQEKLELNPTQVFSFVGYEYHLHSALVKPTREMAQTSGFDPTSKVKTCFDCKMFDVSNWVACLNGEDGPGGTPSHEALSVSSQGALEISSVVGQPPSLDSCHFCTPGLVAESCKRDERCRPSSQTPQYPTLTDASNEGWGAHLDQSSTKGLWSDQEKGLHINVLELKAVSLALRRFKYQCQNQTVLVETDNSTVVAYINKQGGTHSAEMCALLWKIMTWCHHYHITLKVRHIPGCLNVMADLLSRSNQVQSTEWSLHPQVFKRICHRWFTPRVDLFATHLNHKLPLYVSPIPEML